MQAYAGATAPSGWKVCDGSAVSRTDYAQLFANIGTKYGVGDGSTTFNLPDGPSDSFWVDLDVTGTNWTTGSAKGKVTNFDGVYALDFQIKGTTSSVVSNIAVQIGGVSISAAQSSSGWSQQSGVSDRITLFVRESAGGLQIASSGGSSDSWSMNGRVLLAGKPTDAFVGDDSRFSTFDEALESQTIIKLYDDSTTAVSVSVAEATADTAGVVQKPNGMLRLDTGNGHGSTGTQIRRFTNITESVGDAFTYVDSATDGMSVTANRDMIVSVSYTDRDDLANSGLGISLNASSLTTHIINLSASERIASAYTGIDIYTNLAAAFRVSSGDVIRAHTFSQPDNTTSAVQFVITEVTRL